LPLFLHNNIVPNTKQTPNQNNPKIIDILFQNLVFPNSFFNFVLFFSNFAIFKSNLEETTTLVKLIFVVSATPELFSTVYVVAICDSSNNCFFSTPAFRDCSLYETRTNRPSWLTHLFRHFSDSNLTGGRRMMEKTGDLEGI